MDRASWHWAAWCGLVSVLLIKGIISKTSVRLASKSKKNHDFKYAFAMLLRSVTQIGSYGGMRDAMQLLHICGSNCQRVRCGGALHLCAGSHVRSQ